MADHRLTPDQIDTAIGWRDQGFSAEQVAELCAAADWSPIETITALKQYFDVGLDEGQTMVDAVAGSAAHANDSAWDRFAGPDDYSPGHVTIALNSVFRADSEASAIAAYNSVLSAIGNNHAGTMYPAAIEAARILELAQQQELSEWSAWAIKEIAFDLETAFIAEPGFEWVVLPSGQLCDLERTVRAIFDNEIELAAELPAFVGWPVDSLDESGLAPIHRAARGTDQSSDLARLIEAGAEVDLMDADGWTALHHAASCGYSDNARLLLLRGANASATTKTARTASQVASANGHVSLAKTLRAHPQ